MAENLNERRDALQRMMDFWKVNNDEIGARQQAMKIKHTWPASDEAERAMQVLRTIDLETSRPVNVVRVDMPLPDMMACMLKWSIASIPAAIVLFIVWTVFIYVLSGVLSSNL